MAYIALEYFAWKCAVSELKHEGMPDNLFINVVGGVPCLL